MTTMTRRLWTALAALVLSAMLGVPQVSAQTAAQPARVFAASSLTDVLDALAPMYAATGHPRPVFNYAASSVLARQIEQGAPADLFISADEPWMAYVATRNLIDPATRVNFLSNRLVLVAPHDRPFTLEIRPGFDLAGALHGGKLAMADPDSVPAGRYGRAALQSLGAWDGVQASVVRGENVRAALRYVETGDAAAGIVYATDAQASGSHVVVVGTFPETSHPLISYPMAVISGGRTDEARAFAAFLQSDAAKTVFRQQGFILQH